MLFKEFNSRFREEFFNKLHFAITPDIGHEEILYPLSEYILEAPELYNISRRDVARFNPDLAYFLRKLQNRGLKNLSTILTKIKELNPESTITQENFEDNIAKLKNIITQILAKLLPPPPMPAANSSNNELPQTRSTPPILSSTQPRTPNAISSNTLTSMPTNTQPTLNSSLPAPVSTSSNNNYPTASSTSSSSASDQATVPLRREIPAPIKRSKEEEKREKLIQQGIFVTYKKRDRSKLPTS